MTEPMAEARLRAAVLVVSDRATSGERADATGPALCEFLKTKNVQICAVHIVPDEQEQITRALIALCEAADVVITAGGTGLALRDVTPEATAAVIDRQVPGMAEAMRAAGLLITPHAMLSRGLVGMRNQSLILNLPGSPRAAVESLEAVWPAVPHAVAIIAGTATEKDHTHARAEAEDS